MSETSKASSMPQWGPATRAGIRAHARADVKVTEKVPQWGPATRAGIRQRNPSRGQHWKTCLNGVRPQGPESGVRGAASRHRRHASMGSGHNGRTQLLYAMDANSSAHAASMGSGHKGRNQSTSGGPFERTGPVASMGSGHKGRNQPWGAHRREEQQLIASMGSGHKGRNQRRPRR